MLIGHTELFVRDPHASRRFYEEVLGFELVAVQGDNVGLKLGDREILLRPGTGRESSTRYADTSAAIVLYTDDFAGTMQSLRARGLRFDGFDGCEKCPTFRDPDGHWFQLVNPNDHG